MIKETRYIDTFKLKNLCIANRWYTKGSADEYKNMFDLADKDITTEDIVSIASDICLHSDTEYNFYSVCHEISKICYSFFEVDTERKD